MILVKQTINEIVKPLTYIFNLSFQTGIVPINMKRAKVIPLFKTGNKYYYNNYRPVSLLPQFSKILEKLYNIRLDNFINKHNLLHDNQYGFRNNRSTAFALMDSIEEITNQTDKKKIAVGLFIDLKKAFDTINHNNLTEKLDLYGIRGVALNWVKSYLSNRTQFVKLNENSSSYLDIDCGLPQGSVLGPILFILFINDLCKVSQLFTSVLFADDSNLFCAGENLEHLFSEIESEILKLKT